MAFEKTVPQWHAAGTEPPESLKTSGFTGGYQPPADFFNWFWHGVSEALAELQNHAAQQPESKIALYTDLAQIGLTVGSESISNIANALPNNSILMCATGSSNSDIYPDGKLGILVVEKVASSRINCTWTQRSTGATYISNVVDGTWYGWKRVGFQYTSLTQINVTSGSETIESIVEALPDNSNLVYSVSTAEESIYPTNYGLVTVTKLTNGRTKFEFISTIGTVYVGMYNVGADSPWTGWKKVYNEVSKPTPADIGAAASSHNHSASNITSGTLPVARGGTGNTSVDTTPTSGSTKMVTSGGVYTALAGKADSSHTQAASTITAGTFSATGVKAKSGTDYSTARVRNISAGTADLTAGTSTLESGSLYFTYKTT